MHIVISLDGIKWYNGVECVCVCDMSECHQGFVKVNVTRQQQIDALTNQRPVFRSRDLSRPIRDQNSGGRELLESAQCSQVNDT